MMQILITVSLFVCFVFSTSVMAGVGSITGVVRATPPKFLPETVVFIKEVPGNYTAKTVQMDQQKMTFTPHMLTITLGDTVQFWNHDSLVHDVFSPSYERYRLPVISPGKSGDYIFHKNVGTYTQLCDLHPEMLAYIFVGQNPWSAIPDAQGHYIIANIPSGSYELDIWNSHLQASPQNVTISDGQTTTVDFTLKK